MKKVWFAIAFTLIVIYGSAQVPGFSIGPKLGFNINKLTSDIDSISIDPKGQFQIGAFMRIGKKIYFQPEVSYVVKGGEMNLSNNLGNQEVTLKSITIPLLVGVRPINAGVFNVRFMAGPTMSFVIDKTLKPKDLPGAWPLKTTDDFANTLWSFQMGGGIDVLFMTLDLRYEVGLSNMYTGTSDFKMRNNVFNVSLGLKLL
jgi:hypothetical protein